MNPWITRIIILILAVPLVPIIVNGTAKIITNSIQATQKGVIGLLSPVGMSGQAGLEGAIRLGLYLIVVTLIARFFFSRRG
jgi:hypothetical protein